MTRAIVAAVTLLSLARPLAAQEPAAPSLYVRLGGLYAIASVVDYFVDRLEWHPVIRANPAARRAFAETPRAGLKHRITELVCEATGGPCRYTGRSMDEVHEGMGITDAEWQAMAEEFVRALRRYRVPEREQEELLAIVTSLKGDIVTVP